MKKRIAIGQIQEASAHADLFLCEMRCLRYARYKDGDRAHALIETIIDDVKPKPAMLNELLELLSDDEGK